MKKASLLLVAALSVSACASMVKGPYQHVSVNTFYHGQQIDGAHCTLKNDKGTWHVMSQGSADVRRSSKPLTVTCVKSGYGSSQHDALAADEYGIWADRLAGGIVGTIIDARNETDKDYSPVITVEMGAKKIVHNSIEKRNVEE